MPSTAYIDNQISLLEQRIAALRESLRIKQQSLANINPKYQANQAYIAKLNAQIAEQTAELNQAQTSVASLVAERNKTDQTAKQKVSPKTDPEANQTARVADAASLPPYDDEGNLNYGWQINQETGEPYYTGEFKPVAAPTKVAPTQTGYTGTPYDDDGNLNPGWSFDENNNPVYVGGDFVEPATAASAAASREAAARQRARDQQTLAARRNLNNPGDWRFRIRLSPAANYLYNAGNPGILAPLRTNGGTDGVIFPYTPSVETNYQAKYDSYDLTHSNYRGYFYKSSAVENINVRGTFTAQDTTEAQYLLAVIHFFRSVTKMFYGQDPNAGVPPPLCYVSGFGQYQFNDHPVLITNFAYSLPTDVDYIRADNPNNYGLNLENRRLQGSGPSIGGSLGLGTVASRLLNNLLKPGAEKKTPNPSNLNQNVNNTNPSNSTYVPTKMEISLVLLPTQTRSQVSKQFSLEGFANGQLLKGGFW